MILPNYCFIAIFSTHAKVLTKLRILVYVNNKLKSNVLIYYEFTTFVPSQILYKKVNMNLQFSVLLLASAIVCFSCKEKPLKNEAPKDPVTTTINQSANIEAFYPMLNQSDLSTNEVAAFRKSAYPIAVHRNKESGQKSYPILTKGKWAYEGIFKGSEFINMDSTQIKWIQFKDNLTYEYGENKSVKGKGLYSYSFDSGILLLVDDEIAIKPHEYNVKAHNDLIILEGMPTYEDNNIQAKLVRIE